MLKGFLGTKIWGVCSNEKLYSIKIQLRMKINI